jgi:hypothetical protein
MDIPSITSADLPIPAVLSIKNPVEGQNEQGHPQQTLRHPQKKNVDAKRRKRKSVPSDTEIAATTDGTKSVDPDQEAVEGMKTILKTTTGVDKGNTEAEGAAGAGVRVQHGAMNTTDEVKANLSDPIVAAQAVAPYPTKILKANGWSRSLPPRRQFHLQRLLALRCVHPTPHPLLPVAQQLSRSSQAKT